ncbi:MAG: metalloregulator ArsR/SmtB family transcription factor [Candidatus Eisenbacteria bacterium]
MQARDREVLRARAEIIKALAHPTRLFIVEELARAESCVADITAKVGADMSTVSRHLSILKEAGIIQSVKRGAQVHYSLRVPCILNFFGCVEAVLRSSAAERTKVAQAAGRRR